MIEPLEEQIQRVIDLGIVVKVDGKYDYSDSMKKSIKDYLGRRHGAFEVVKLQRSVADFTLPTVVAYPDCAKEINLLGTVALMTLWHIKRVGLNYNYKKEKDSANFLYALFYLDHLIPDVEAR